MVSGKQLYNTLQVSINCAGQIMSFLWVQKEVRKKCFCTVPNGLRFITTLTCMYWSFKKCLRFTSLGLKRTEKSLYIETQS